MTHKERETCTRILGFLDAVSKVESNIFSGGAEHAKRMMQEILKEEDNLDADGSETLPG